MSLFSFFRRSGTKAWRWIELNGLLKTARGGENAHRLRACQEAIIVPGAGNAAPIRYCYYLEENE
jgi:hypothetical protein